MPTAEPDGPGRDDTPSGISSRVPARRLGTRLRNIRRSRHRTRREVARATDIRPGALRAAERGTHLLAEGQLQSLLATYRVTLSELLPERSRPVTVADGTLSVAGQVRTLATDDPTPDEVLARYLELVYELRGRKAGDPLTLRDDDLDTLADALGGEPATVEARLVQLMGCSGEEAADLRHAILRRRVLVPAAGLVMGATALTGAGFDASGPNAATARADSAAEVDVGDAAVLPGVDIDSSVRAERHPDGADETTTRSDPPPSVT